MNYKRSIMKTSFYALYPIEDFKKMVFFKLKSMGFNKASLDSIQEDKTHKAAVAKSLQDEISKIENTLSDYKEYLNEIMSQAK